MAISKKVYNQSQFTKHLSMLFTFIYRYYPDLTVTQGEAERTKYQQLKYVKDGKSDTMNSMHRIRCAQDLNFYDTDTGKWIGNGEEAKKRLKTVGQYWESLSDLNKWGGRFKLKFGRIDTPHFERYVK